MIYRPTLADVLSDPHGDPTDPAKRDVAPVLVSFDTVRAVRELPSFRVRDAIQAVVNGVPLSMGRAIAKAVRRALAERTYIKGEDS